MISGWAVVAAGVGSLSQPLQLVTEHGDSTVNFSVVGQASAACDVRYELLVEGGPAGRSNRSTQRGRAQLLPDQTIVVARSAIGTRPGSMWRATLRVTPCDGIPYELSSSSR